MHHTDGWLLNLPLCQTQIVSFRLEVPFYVKNTQEFNKEYPLGSNARLKLERQVG